MKRECFASLLDTHGPSDDPQPHSLPLVLTTGRGTDPGTWRPCTRDQSRRGSFWSWRRNIAGHSMPESGKTFWRLARPVPQQLQCCRDETEDSRKTIKYIQLLPKMFKVVIEIYCWQCSGSGSESGSTGSTCFWAFRIRILLSWSKYSKKNLDFYYLWNLFDFLSLKMMNKYL
jgi:hypothetical protein